MPEGAKFITLDEVERKLSAEDLMICDEKEGMCIAGVFGGVNSGVTEKTRDIFLESAHFDPVSVRRTAKLHELNTDASFRFERGSDPNITVYALKRVAMLIKEIAGGEISSDVVDLYPEPVEDFKVELTWSNCDRLIGKKINRDKIKQILTSLEIRVEDESENGLSLAVPPFKVDVKREADIIEEVLRIYGYNNIELTGSVNSYISKGSPGDPPIHDKVKEVISTMLSENGFYEIMSNSISRSGYYKNDEEPVRIINPLNAELDIMRQTLLYGGLEAVAYNQNRQNSDLKLYEFGSSYYKTDKGIAEPQHLVILICGRTQPENWNTTDGKVDFYYLKGFVNNIIERLGIGKPGIKCSETGSDVFSEGSRYEIIGKKVVEFGRLKKSLLKDFDIKQDVYYADFYWDNVIKLLGTNVVLHKNIPKFPSVRRDLALLIDRKVNFSEIKELAYQTEKNLLKDVNLFDVYEGDQIEEGKKSYAVSYIFQNPAKTLTDELVDGIMDKLMKIYSEKLGAVIR